MKNIALLFGLAGWFSACQNNDQTASALAKAQRDPVHFLQSFPIIEQDSFLVESAQDEPELQKAGFFGKELDSVQYVFFNDPVLIKWIGRGGGLLHACYRFPVADSIWGLVVRSPSDYWDSSIRVFLFDAVQNKTLGDLEVAEHWGDAGDALTKKSLLIRGENGWKILQFQRVCHPEEEDNFDSITCTDSTFVFRILPNAFQQTAQSAADTSQTYPLMRRFSRLSR